MVVSIEISKAIPLILTKRKEIALLTDSLCTPDNVV